MTLLDLILEVRALTRDFSNSIFRERDIISFLNGGVNRVRQVIPELRGMKTLSNKLEEVTLLPSEYMELLVVFSVSRCFMQDESFYQASTYMNEFETKLEELKSAIENGDIVIRDEEGTPIHSELDVDFVKDEYFSRRRG